MQSPALRARFLHERAKTNKYLGLITSELARLLSLSPMKMRRGKVPPLKDSHLLPCMTSPSVVISVAGGIFI